MTAPLVVITGTGTEIGKTHVAAALVIAWSKAFQAAGLHMRTVAGLKPVESGVKPGTSGDDGGMLERLSTFHVKRFPPPYLLARAVSPHLAAREEGRTIALAPIATQVANVRREADAVLVELAGGLFSPLAVGLTNLDVARELHADRVLLVAPDRLGVLHDVAATERAAIAEGLRLDGIILVAPSTADASTGSNAAELSLVTSLPVLATVPRGTSEDLAHQTDIRAIVSALIRR